MLWNKLSGNAYTASLWISVANALQGLSPGERIAAFSYGSGFGAELLSLVAGPAAKEGAWAADIEKDVANRPHDHRAGLPQAARDRPRQPSTPERRGSCGRPR